MHVAIYACMMHVCMHVCTYQFVTSISPPPPSLPRGKPRAFELSSLAAKFPSPSFKKLFKCPTCKTRWKGKCPTPGKFFLTVIVSFFILNLEKGISYAHSKASPSFYSPFLVSHSITNAISCLLNHLIFSLRSCLAPWWPSVRLFKFPTSAAWCQILHPLGEGGCQMPLGYPGAEGCWGYNWSVH